MSRLVINPGTSQATEITLKPGVNTVGRGSHNDVQISDASVSGSHCELTLQDGCLALRDVGSTNGTFVNGTQVQTATFADGQPFRLGSVEVCFYSSATAPAAASRASAAEPQKLVLSSSGSGQPSLVIAPPATPGAPPIPQPNLGGSSLRPPGLRISGGHSTSAAAPAEAGSDGGETPPPAFEAPAGPRFCKFHPKSIARFLCRKCNRTFCDLCVSSRSGPGGLSVKTCRSCGVECQPLTVERSGQKHRGFFGHIPGAFVYPFKGMGPLILIVATIVFAALSFVSAGIFTIFLKMAVMGYIFLFMQNIVHATAAEEHELPGLPDFEGLFGAFFTLAGTVIMSFGLAIGLAIAKFFEVDTIPTAALTAALVFGCIYFPMAFLASAMKDTALASNPLVVVPAIMRVPLEYTVTVILMGTIFGVQQLGEMLSERAGDVVLTTRSMAELFMAFGVKSLLAFIGVYLLTVNMRILGMLYVTKKDRLGWF
ncbi:MAG TPA: FHA domain-containing protein [Verrucomicrobiae bacterium]|nr:FHA domain-containing protein [Verrucomicrobiae bacterium]